jgi:hypothetical protein
VRERAPVDRRRAARPEPAGRRERRARGRGVAVFAFALAGTALVFFAGLAVGRALDDAPRPGGGQTLVRTLSPGTISPATQTVTVTTGTP